LAETIIGLFKTEVIYARGPWRTFDEVEYAILEWADGEVCDRPPLQRASDIRVLQSNDPEFTSRHSILIGGDM